MECTLESEVTMMDRFNAPKYDVSVFPEPNYPQNKYIIMYNGVKWLLNYRGPGFYDKLGAYDTKELAYKAYLEHQKQKLQNKINKLQEMLNNEYS
jgi:hypothetical protein